MGHPCLSCGACCAYFRVAFHWSESDFYAGGQTPSELTEKLDPHRLVMRGTQASRPRCTSLAGDIGAQVACRIYTQRPSPCRDLEPAWASGRPSPQCDRARLAHGLAPLAPDWNSSSERIVVLDEVPDLATDGAWQDTGDAAVEPLIH